MALLNTSLQRILEPRGFYEYYVDLRKDLTREQAYEECEKTVELITGQRRYRDFRSFEQVAARFDRKRAAT